MSKLEKVERKRINTMIPADILAQVDEFANSLGLTRGGALSVISKTYFDQQEVIKLSRLAELIENREA